MSKLIKFESDLLLQGINVITGVDEAGRGPLAGPLVVAAVSFNKSDIKLLYEEKNIIKEFEELNDSKKLTDKKRRELSSFIKENANAYSIQVIEHTIIDQKGIVTATQIGFFNAVKDITKTQHVLTDHFRINALSEKLQTNISKGDSLSISIAAASIIAKVHRDDIMLEYAKKYTKYGFDKHKGYGTKQHKEAILEFGPCEIHRKSFEPIKSILNFK